MKHLKFAFRALSLVMALLLALTLVIACTDDTPADEPQPDQTDEQPDTEPVIDLSGYTLMRSDTAGNALRTAFGRMSSVIKEICGVQLKVGTDYVDKNINDRAEYEIIVGHTNIPEENAIYEQLSEGEYIIAAEGTKIFVVGNWSSFEGRELQEVKSEKVIICPGAINKDRNQMLLVDAFSKIAADFPDWRIHIYGKGKARDEEALAKRIGSRRLEGRILLKGYADLTEAYSECAFVAFPSKTEGFGMAILDAAMFTKPTLMIRDWVGCGEVVAPENYAGALRRLMSDGQCRRISGEKSQAFCRGHYSR